MSVLTDSDFLLHALQLSYLRHVLPNHASLSASAAAPSPAGGSGAYSLVAFAPPADLAASNPYLALSGAADPLRWPELGAAAAGPSGRSSPPLAPLLASEAAPRRGLQYSQTIGKGVASVGIKVDGGRPRTWKGKGRLARAEGGRENGQDAPASRTRFAEPPESSFSSTSGVAASPADFPPRALGGGAEGTPAGESLASSGVSLFGAPAPALQEQRPSSSGGSSSGEDSDFPAGPAPPKQALHEPVPAPPAFQLPPGFRPRERRRVNIRPGEALAPAPAPSLSSSADSDFGGRMPAAPAPPAPAGPAPAPEPPAFQLPAGFRPRERRRVNIPALAPAPAPPRAPSLSSSADSDFGERMPRSPSPVAAKEPVVSTIQLPPGFRPRERRRVNIRPGEVLAPAAPPPALPPVERDQGASLSSSPDSDFADRMPPPPPVAAADEGPAVPAIQLPPGLRLRERRRVNVRPGAVLAQLQATDSEASLSVGAGEGTAERAGSSGASDAGGGLPSPLTPLTPAPVAATLPPQAAQEAQVAPAFQLPPGLRVRERRRVNIRPGAVLAQAQADAQESPPPPPPPFPPPPPPPPPAQQALRLPAPRRRSSRPPSPDGPYFPPRAAYLSPAPRAPAPATSGRSALSAQLAAHASSAASSSRGPNPFSPLYAACVSRSAQEGDAVPLRLFFPASAAPERPVEVRVKRDVSVEEVLGVGLWAYWEEGREPPLEDVEVDDAREGRETARWALRIVEDGEVDEDFPALDRMRNISAFGFTEFAVVRDEEEQVEDNLAKQATIVRRPSRILASAPPAAAPPAQPASPLDPQTCAAGSALAVPVLLKIALPPVTAAEGVIARERGEEVGVQTTVQVPSDTYLADVLELVIRKRGFRTSAREWALVVRLQDGDLVVPLDRTVESLGEQHELELVPRAQVGPGGVRKMLGASGRNQDPSQSIFMPSHLAAAAQPAYQSAAAAATAAAAPYLHFSVLRKLPMSLGGRHARVIAIDGDYLHFMPPEGNLPALTRGRTTSFHVSAVHACKISRRSASSFKIVVHTKRGVDKRYDFEAESPERAREIVETVRRVMEFYRAERGGR
ncbi:Component of a membrane-bound complex containing the Tor2p kinase [Rhodotorula kratochvilovae]